MRDGSSKWQSKALLQAVSGELERGERDLRVENDTGGKTELATAIPRCVVPLRP